MSITVKVSSDEELIKSVVYHPKVVATALPPEERLALKHRGITKMRLHPLNYYLIAYYNGDIMGAIRWSYFTNTTLEFHAYTLPKYWGMGLPKELKNVVCEQLKLLTQCTKIITFVPASCRHVQKALMNCGFVPESAIPNSIRWKSSIPEHLYIFGATI